MGGAIILVDMALDFRAYVQQLDNEGFWIYLEGVERACLGLATASSRPYVTGVRGRRPRAAFDGHQMAQQSMVEPAKLDDFMAFLQEERRKRLASQPSLESSPGFVATYQAGSTPRPDPANVKRANFKMWLLISLFVLAGLIVGVILSLSGIDFEHWWQG